MYLYTLGGLELDGGNLSRPKPLLLLAYLTLEGAKERRHLGELFYLDTTTPMTGLRVAFGHIREAAKGVLSEDDTRVGALLECDALELLKAFENHDDQKTLGLYRGAFLEGFYLKGLSSELEEWVLGTREYLASLVRQAALRLGETAASKGDAPLAAQYAEQAYLVPAAPPPEPKQLELLYSLLVAGKSSRTSQLRKEIEDLGMPLPFVTQETQTQSVPTSPYLESNTSIPHNLPDSTTTFVGRQNELEELAHYLRDPHHRLITLVGPGGIGKTRLSIELARGQLEVKDWEGVYFLALETMQEASFIPVYLANTLGFRLEGNDPPLDQLRGLIGQKPLLLILDNFEHLTSGAAILNDLLRHFPHFKFIVSSRERLNLAAEAVYEVEGLSVPPHTHLEGDGLKGDRVENKELESSLQLFLQRVRQANLRFQLTPENLPDVANICRLVEGIPLALELAAAWVRTMPLKEIANELSTNPDFLVSQKQDALERHKSLRAVFEHSWKLLKTPEQEALQKLSVFRGGFRREAAARVTGATIPVLASLVDKSLVRTLPNGRYDRHMLLYQFAREKLAQNPELERDCERHHAHYFLSLAEEAESQLRLANQSYWLKRLDEETNNFQAVLGWSLQHDIDTGLRLVGALGLFWYFRSSFEEGRYWFEKVLAQPGLPQNTLHTKVLFNAGRLARSYGDFGGARKLLERCLELCGSIGDDAGAVKSLNELGILAAVESDYQKATDFFERGLELAKTIADDEGLGLILSNLGFLNTILGSFKTAQGLFEQGLVLSRKRGDNHGTAHLLNNLALVAVRQHDYAGGLSLYEESLGFSQELQDKQTMAESILGIGVVCNMRGHYAKAKVYVRQSLELYFKLRKTPGIIDALYETASLASSNGDPLLAARLWGMTNHLRKRLNFPMPPFELSRYHHDLSCIQTLLNAELFERARAEGELWSLDDAVQQALAWLDNS
jgi:predicted ATPase